MDQWQSLKLKRLLPPVNSEPCSRSVPVPGAATRPARLPPRFAAPSQRLPRRTHSADPFHPPDAIKTNSPTENSALKTQNREAPPLVAAVCDRRAPPAHRPPPSPRAPLAPSLDIGRWVFDVGCFPPASPGGRHAVTPYLTKFCSFSQNRQSPAHGCGCANGGLSASPSPCFPFS